MPPLPDRPTTLWRRGELPERAPLADDATADVVVVGGGITGLATAVACAEAGLDVLVLEDRQIDAGVTCLSTAKVSVLHGLRYSSLTERHGPQVTGRYADAQLAGLAWLRDRAGDVLEPATAATFATDAETRRQVEAEVAAAQAAGIGARFAQLDLPFPTDGAVVVDDQAQVEPVALQAALAARLESLGGRIAERTRVLGVHDRRGGAAVRTADAEVVAGWVVVATGLPIIDRALLFARTEPKSSYCIAIRTSDPLPEEMLLSAGEPVRSTRTAADPERPGQRVLVVGGAGHKTGSLHTTLGRYEELIGWASEHFAVDEVPWRWSAEDFQSDDGLPFVGPSPFSSRVLVATGYAKWGFTNGAAAALALAAHITEDLTPAWSSDWSPRRVELRTGGRELVKANADVAAKLVSGWVGLASRGKLLHPTTSATLDDERHEVSAVCTHLGGIVRWNDGDGCWDCPLHGSRFDADGTLLHGPAVKDLDRKDGGRD
jgi:glycine/D-amino acid oxidase-like deaminating enzyme